MRLIRYTIRWVARKEEREIGSDKPSKKGQGIRRFHEFTSQKKQQQIQVPWHTHEQMLRIPTSVMYLWHFMALTCRNKKVCLLTSVSDDPLGSLHLHCRSSILPAGPGALAAVDEGRGKRIQQVLLNHTCMQSCSLCTSGWAT